MNQPALDFEREIPEWEQLCRAVASAYYAPGLDPDDLIQEARIGAWKGLRDFRGERGNLQAFMYFCIKRQVQTALTMARRGKHGPLNSSLRVVKNDEDEEVEALELVADAKALEPHATLAQREELQELARTIRERLSDRECACLLRHVNGYSYEEIAAELKLTRKSVDTALTQARYVLTGDGPPSAPQAAHRRRRGDAGYTCPSCGGATVKKPGRGRPPRCNVCRTRPKALAA